MKNNNDYKSDTEILLELLKTMQRIEKKMPDNNRTDIGIIEESELCRTLGLSRWTLADLRNEGKLCFAQIGRRIYYKTSDVMDMFNEHFRRL